MISSDMYLLSGGPVRRYCGVIACGVEEWVKRMSQVVIETKSFK
jgi:hypothetical protein